MHFWYSSRGMHQDLRLESIERLTEIGFDGYAIGGLSVGEPKEEMFKVLSYLPANMPSQSPRYLMGVGTPEDIINAVDNGVDMFDCVMPSRNARNGHLFTSNGVVKIKNAIHKKTLIHWIRIANVTPVRITQDLTYTTFKRSMKY